MLGWLSKLREKLQRGAALRAIVVGIVIVAAAVRLGLIALVAFAGIASFHH